MSKLILAEFKKLKGTSIPWICLAGCFIIPLMAVIMNQRELTQHTWKEYYQQNAGLGILFLWPAMFGLVGSYLLIRERTEQTYKNLLVIPVGRMQLALAKLVVLVCLILGMTAVSYCFNLTGVFLGISVSSADWFYGLKTYLVAGIMVFLAVTPIFWIAQASRSFLTPVGVLILYEFVVFLGIWSAKVSSLLPSIVVLRITHIYIMNIVFSLSENTSYICFGFVAILSCLGLFITAKYQELC